MKTLRNRCSRALLALAMSAFASLALAAELVIGQVVPLSGVLASTGHQMVVGGKIYFEAINEQGGIHGATIKQVGVDDAYKVDETSRLTTGGITVSFSPGNRVGSRYVEVTVIGNSGKLLK